MRIAVISDCTYPACLPQDPCCTLYYGSESYHALLAKALSERGHDIIFYAPRGSTPIGEFHPLTLMHGNAPLYDNLETVGLNGLKTKDIIDQKVEFVIDMSASAMIPFLLWKDYQFTDYCCYRNGFEAFGIWPPHIPPEHRNYVVPSFQNKKIFDAKSGYAATKVAYYGIDESFYHPTTETEMTFEWYLFEAKYGLLRKDYFLFPHRPTQDKGIQTVLRLALDFPKENFVIVSSTPILEHRKGIYQIERLKEEKSAQNLHIVTIPIQPKHHYYKRELLRNAKAILSPFDTSIYKEGFGLANAEAVACGTPLIISDSESTRELWTSRTDDSAIICNSNDYYSFHNAIKNFEYYTLCPSNKFKVEDYAARYEQIADDIINNKDTINNAEMLLKAT